MAGKILVIDDEVLLLRVYEKKLKHEGFEVVTAQSSREGLEKAKSTKPHLILLDILMPSMDGFQVLERLKSDPETKEIPVMFLTNLSKEGGNIQKGLEKGAVAYLEKVRFRPSEVIKKIKEVLGLVPPK